MALIRRVGTSLPYEPDLPVAQERLEVTHKVIGVLRPDDKFSEAFPDLVLLENHPDHVFSRMPFASSAVQYQLYVSMTDISIRHASLPRNGVATKTIVLKASWKARKHCIQLVHKIFAEEKLPWNTSVETAFRAGGFDQLLLGHPESLGVKLLSLHKDIFKLCCAKNARSEPAFQFKAVMSMSAAKIKHAAYLMRTDPFRLCFRRAHGLTELPDMAGDKAKSFDGLQDHIINFYDFLKRKTFSERHSIVDASYEITTEGIHWLVGNGVVERSEIEPKMVELIEIHEAERALLEAIANIEASVPLHGKHTENVLLTSGNVLCDEQETALTILRHKPILAIDGRAGSGKTDFLNVVIQLYGKDKVFCTAFQGVNAGQLARLGTKASTTHKLIYEHALNHSPFACAMKGIEVLVIDEAGTQSLTLLAALLSAFALCGAHNKKLVLVGDLGQLPPIGGPAPFRYLVKYFASRGYLVRFVHNHRVNPDARLLAENANAILRGAANDINWNEDSFVLMSPPEYNNKSPLETMLCAIDRFELMEDDFIVVTHRNRDRDALCAAIERKFGGSGESGIEVGHKFCFTKNDYGLGTVNNEILVLEAIQDRIPRNKQRPKNVRSTRDHRLLNSTRYLIARRSDDSILEVPYEGTTVGRIKKASAVTSHAMQGSARRVVIRVDYGPSIYSTRERLYTDVTRAEKTFIYVGQLEWLKAAVGRLEPVPPSHLEALANKMHP